MAVLITGGAGFIGAHVARRLLHADHKVVVLDTTPANVLQETLTPDELREVLVVPGDAQSVRDLGEAICAHKVDRIVHLASLMHPECDLNPSRAVAVNVGSQVGVLEAARLWGLAKLVWASSVVVFGRRSPHLPRPLPNNAPHLPVSVYGATKDLNEHLSLHYARQWGVDALGLRFTLVYGPGRIRGASAFINIALAQLALDEPATIPFGDDVVDWQYVEDIARLIEQCLFVGPTRTRVFNTRCDIRPVREVGRYVSQLLPEARIEYGDGEFGLPWELDDSALQEEIGFRPEYSMERGMLETANHIRRRRGLPPLEPPADTVSPERG